MDCACCRSRLVLPPTSSPHIRSRTDKRANEGATRRYAPCFLFAGAGDASNADCRQITQVDSAMMPSSSRVSNQVNGSISRNPILYGNLQLLQGIETDIPEVKFPNVVKLELLQNARLQSLLQLLRQAKVLYRSMNLTEL